MDISRGSIPVGVRVLFYLEWHGESLLVEGTIAPRPREISGTALMRYSIPEGAPKWNEPGARDREVQVPLSEIFATVRDCGELVQSPNWSGEPLRSAAAREAEASPAPPAAKLDSLGRGLKGFAHGSIRSIELRRKNKRTSSIRVYVQHQFEWWEGDRHYRRYISAKGNKTDLIREAIASGATVAQILQKFFAEKQPCTK